MRSTLYLTVATLALTAGSLQAQEAGALPRVLQLPSSTRAMALGDAYAITSGHADAVFYHPALLAGASGFGIDVQRWDTEGDAAAMSGAFGWLGGTIGVGLQTLQFSGPGTGGAAAPVGQSHLFEAGGTPVSETVTSIGFARDLFGFDVGIVGKLAEERVGGGRSATVLFDAGIASDVGPMRAALSYRNLGSEHTLGGVDVPTPDQVTLGIGFYGKQIGFLDLGVNAAFVYQGEEVLPGGGVEFGYWPISGRTFVARVGARRTLDDDMSPVTFGFAFWGDDVTLEWAFQPTDGEPAGTHRFGVRWR